MKEQIGKRFVFTIRSFFETIRLSLYDEEENGNNSITDFKNIPLKIDKSSPA